MSEPRALIFDVDGTLADTERDGHRVAFNEAFAEAGLDWEWDVETYGRLLAVSGGKERIRHYVLDELAAEARPEAASGGSALDALVPALHARKTELYTAAVGRGAIGLRPGVERLLSEARTAGLRLAIATTTTYPNVTALLGATLGERAVDWFEVIGAGDVVPRKKPADDIYRYVLERLALDPGDCIAFEDSANGLRSALGAGLRTVVTFDDYTRDDDFRGAALVVDGFGTPDRPFRTVAGDAHGRSMIDLALLRHL